MKWTYADIQSKRYAGLQEQNLIERQFNYIRWSDPPKNMEMTHRFRNRLHALHWLSLNLMYRHMHSVHCGMGEAITPQRRKRKQD